ncbi:SRPBCC family protein [Schumannella soli]|nr:SRPBCC domain-containing protein [Schumannella soli]
MPGPRIHVAQFVAADLSRVWTALTTSAGVGSWWWSHWAGVDVRFDAVVGDDYSIAAPQQGIHLVGRFEAVEPESRLVLTWRWRDAERSDPEERVEIRLTPSTERPGTEVTVQHSGPWTSDAPGELNLQGWTFTLGQLARTLA